MTATCERPATSVRNASVCPSGELRGDITRVIGPTSRLPFQIGAGASVCLPRNQSPGKGAAAEEYEAEHEHEDELPDAARLWARGSGAACTGRRRERRGRRRLAEQRRHGRARARQQLRGRGRASTTPLRRARAALRRGLLEIGELVADLFELSRELRGRVVALVGILREAALDRPAQRRRYAGVQSFERERLVLDDRRQRLDGRGAVEEAADASASRRRRGRRRTDRSGSRARGRPPARATCSRAFR